MADLRIVDAPVLLQESITDDVKIPTGGLGNFSIRLGDIVWYVVTKEQLANKNYVDLSSKSVKDGLDEHIADKANPHNVTKAQVGLGNVDNTADVDKPVSNAAKLAIDEATAGLADKAYVDDEINSLFVDLKMGALVDSTPFATKSALLADTTLADGSFAFVHSDSDLDLNGLYQKVSGVWQYLNVNPSFYIDKRVGYADSNKLQPLVSDDSGNVAVWLDDGKLGFAALSDDAIAVINANQQPNIVTDGRNLEQYNAKAANIKTGASEQLRVVITGDSWTEHNTISSQLYTMFKNYFGSANSGWINLGSEQNLLDNVLINYTQNWKLNDLNYTADYSYGSPPDGFTRVSSQVGEKITIWNLKAGQFTIFFGNTGGTFSYSINDGAAVNVTANSNKYVTITLPNATNSVVVTVVSGNIVIQGFHLQTSDKVEYNKIGNGGTTGTDYLKIAPTAQANFAQFLSPDLVIIILGTNDSWRGTTITDFKNGVSAIIDGYRSINPNVSVILIAPAQNGYTPQVIQSKDLAVAMREVAKTKRAEFYDMFSDWTDYTIENAQNQWNDLYHVSNAGAYRLANKLFKTFLES